MPDLITHVIIGLIFCELLGIRRKSLIILGSILPDIIFKITLICIFIEIPTKEFKWFLVPMHNPAALILLTVLICLFFRSNYQQKFLMICSGWILHLIADLTNKELFMNQMFLLYPFSWKAFELNILWPNQYFYAFFLSLAVYIIIILVKHRKSITHLK